MKLDVGSLPSVCEAILKLALECNRDEASSDEDCAAAALVVEAALDGKELSEDEANLLGEEFLAYMDHGFTDSSADRRAINRWYHENWGLDRHDPNVFCTGRIATCTIKGVKYEAVATA